MTVVERVYHSCRICDKYAFDTRLGLPPMRVNMPDMWLPPYMEQTISLVIWDDMATKKSFVVVQSLSIKSVFFLLLTTGT